MTLLSLFFSSAIFSINNNKIKGKVVEQTSGKLLAFATITIQNEDNTIAGGAYTNEDGTFLLNSISSGLKRITISFIGYENYNKEIKLNNSEDLINLGTIELVPTSNLLQAAIVTSKVPVIEQKLDKLVMNVSEAINTQGSNGLDVIRKAPGVSVDPSGNILLNGQSVQIWIDNRPSNLSGEDLVNLLSTTDGSSIDKIEIMAHPSSKFDASGGGGIINIKTKKLFIKGLNGSARLSYDTWSGDKFYNGASASINASYRSKNNNTFIVIGPRHNENFLHFNSKTVYDENIMESNTKADLIQNSISFRIGNDFYLDKKNILGFVINGVTRGVKMESYGATGSTFFVNNLLTSRTNTDINDGKSLDNISSNINYSFMKKQGEELTINLDYGSYSSSNNSSQVNDLFDSSENLMTHNEFKSDALQNIAIYSGKIDYEKIVLKSAKLETGLKYALSVTDNNMVREDYFNNSWIVNPQLSSIFKYREGVSAGYATLTKQISKKIVTKIGLRAEYTDAEGDWISADSLTSKSYLNFFPNLYIGFNPNMNFRYSLSYSKRISRPNYFQLNPFRQYIDANSAVEGNPDLDPEFTHQFTMSIGVKRNLNITYIFAYSDGKIIQNPTFSVESGNKLMIWENFGKQTINGLSVSITELQLKKWVTLNLNMFGARIYNEDGQGYSSSNFMTQGNANLSFYLPKGFKSEIDATFVSGLPYGYFRVLPQGQVSVSLKKSLLNNKIDLSCRLDDIFGTQRERIVINSSDVEDYSLNQKMRSTFLTFNVNYKFGQGKASRQRKVGEQEEASRVTNP